RRAHLGGAEVIEHVLQVLRRGARVLLGPSREQRVELVEGHDALVARVGLAHLLADARKRLLGAELLEIARRVLGLLHAHFTSAVKVTGCFLGSQEVLLQTANLSSPEKVFLPASAAT